MRGAYNNFGWSCLSWYTKNNVRTNSLMDIFGAWDAPQPRIFKFCSVFCGDADWRTFANFDGLDDVIGTLYSTCCKVCEFPAGDDAFGRYSTHGDCFCPFGLETCDKLSRWRRLQSIMRRL